MCMWHHSCRYTQVSWHHRVAVPHDFTCPICMPENTVLTILSSFSLLCSSPNGFWFLQAAIDSRFYRFLGYYQIKNHQPMVISLPFETSSYQIMSLVHLYGSSCPWIFCHNSTHRWRRRTLGQLLLNPRGERIWQQTEKLTPHNWHVWSPNATPSLCCRFGTHILVFCLVSCYHFE